MNTDPIEKVLRKAPRLCAPAGLREKLEKDITLPRPAPERAVRAGGAPWFKRWFPALSLAVLFFGCLVAIAVQSNFIAELRQQNIALRAAQQAAEEANQAMLETRQRFAAKNAELDRLRRDTVELQKLQQETAQLREQLRELPALRSESQRLLAEQLKAAQAMFPPGVTADDDILAKSKAKAQTTHCINNIKQICLAARMWSNDHKDILPADFLVMRNELNTPKLLVCAGDTARTAAANWSEVTSANVSYEMLSPGVDETDPRIVYVRCPIHGNVGLVDGSAHMLPLNGSRGVVLKEGKYVIDNKNE